MILDHRRKYVVTYQFVFRRVTREFIIIIVILFQQELSAPNPQLGSVDVNGLPLNEPGNVCIFTACFTNYFDQEFRRDPRQVKCSAGKSKSVILLIRMYI